eukprot:TRINITY_DN2321_c0_g1_i1.p1 TRINITY_DN2321_c0_g1~~TRINITY_DN2321_c0_g1_i1.p1  ORF type:complete len:251 (+),score=33.92 TRINITY_DN2321_c0_g1_i1:775-1527(+)
MPIQRITRYHLLLQKVLKETPPNHPDTTGLQQLLTSLADLSIEVDEAIKEKEEHDSAMRLLLKIPQGVDFLKEDRSLIKWGELDIVTGTKASKAYMFFLFSDLLAYVCPGKFTTKWHHCPVFEGNVEENYEDWLQPLPVFSIHMKNNKKIIAIAKSNEEKSKWLKALSTIHKPTTTSCYLCDQHFSKYIASYKCCLCSSYTCQSCCHQVVNNNDVNTFHCFACVPATGTPLYQPVSYQKMQQDAESCTIS